MTTRRHVLTLTGTTAAAALAGCSSDGDSDSDSNSDGGTDSTGTQLTDIIEITNQEWRGRSILEATVRNKTDSTIETLQIDVNVYAGNERISDGYGTITDLSSGIEDTVSVRNMSGFSAVPCEDATTYDLVPNFYFENTQYEQQFEHEYNPEFCE